MSRRLNALSDVVDAIAVLAISIVRKTMGFIADLKFSKNICLHLLICASAATCILILIWRMVVRIPEWLSESAN